MSTKLDEIKALDAAADGEKVNKYVSLYLPPAWHEMLDEIREAIGRPELSRSELIRYCIHTTWEANTDED